MRTSRTRYGLRFAPHNQTVEVHRFANEAELARWLHAASPDERRRGAIVEDRFVIRAKRYVAAGDATWPVVIRNT